MFYKTKILNIMDRPHDSFPVFVEQLKEIEKLLPRKDIFFLKIFNLKKSTFILSLQERFFMNIKPYLNLNNENSKHIFENFYIKYFQHKNYITSRQNCIIDSFFLLEALKINSNIIIQDIVDCNKNNVFFFGDLFVSIQFLKHNHSLNINENQLIILFDYISDKKLIENLCSKFNTENFIFKSYSLYLQQNELKNILKNF